MNKSKISILSLLAACGLTSNVYSQDWISMSTESDTNESDEYVIQLSPSQDYTPAFISDYHDTISTAPVPHDTQVYIDSLESQVASLQAELEQARFDHEQQVQSLEYQISQLESDAFDDVQVKQDLEHEVAHYTWLSDWREQQLFIPMLVGWRYSPTEGWLYTDKQVFPYVYRSDNETWYHFTRDMYAFDNTTVWGAADRVFYNYNTRQWEWWSE